MTRRFLTAAILLVALAPAGATAQGRNVPRTPWGDPDVSGLWTNATLTVLQRPAELD